jgi:hypothetical protein
MHWEVLLPPASVFSLRRISKFSQDLVDFRRNARQMIGQQIPQVD